MFVFLIKLFFKKFIMYTSHSAIPSYPPNVTKYPNFYHCKEHIFVLNPGDMLYIPSKWFHWVFSYPDLDSKHRENIAFSYSVSEFGGDICNEFHAQKPYVFRLDKREHPFFNYTFDTFKEKYNQKVQVLKSTKNVLVPVQKNGNDNISLDNLTFNEIEELMKKDTHNIYMGQNGCLQRERPPECLFRGFPNSKFNGYQWVSTMRKKTEYIDSGLHYDMTHGILIQIRGTKVVRLYSPANAKNLYLQPLFTKKVVSKMKSIL